MPAFGESPSQSQARLMFVTTLGMDNFDCIKMNAHFKKFRACLLDIFPWYVPTEKVNCMLSPNVTSSDVFNLYVTSSSHLF